MMVVMTVACRAMVMPSVVLCVCMCLKEKGVRSNSSSGFIKSVFYLYLVQYGEPYLICTLRGLTTVNTCMTSMHYSIQEMMKSETVSIPHRVYFLNHHKYMYVDCLSYNSGSSL